jgi:hypothetical protein
MILRGPHFYPHTLPMYMYFDSKCTGKYVEEAVAKTQETAILQLTTDRGVVDHHNTRRGILWYVVLVFQ